VKLYNTVCYAYGCVSYVFCTPNVPFFTEIGFMKRFVVVNTAASFLYAVVGTSVFNFKYTFPRDKNPPADE
jgi:hypothetical protein